MKKWMCICAAAVLAVSALTGCSTSAGSATTAAQTEAATTDAAKAETEKKETAKTAEAPEKAQDTASEEIAAAAGKHHVKINVKDYGTISVELYGDEAPITVANFLKLAKDGFYDGLTFHRIISGFMIQGGDPLGTGMGGSDQEIKGEFSNNGVENPLSHTRGAISMARSQIKDSASSSLYMRTAHSWTGITPVSDMSQRAWR